VVSGIRTIRDDGGGTMFVTVRGYARPIRNLGNRSLTMGLTVWLEWCCSPGCTSIISFLSIFSKRLVRVWFAWASP